MARDLDTSTWESACRNNFMPVGAVSESVRVAFSRMILPQPPPPVQLRSISGFPRCARPVGAMWAGVPAMSTFINQEGEWILASSGESELQGYILKLVAANPDDEVQFGFTQVRVNRFEDVLKSLKIAPKKLPVAFCPGARFGSNVRIDRVVRAVEQLAGDTGVAGEAFRAASGSISPTKITHILARSMFTDSRNALGLGGELSSELVGLIIDEMEPGWRSPTTSRQISVFLSCSGLPTNTVLHSYCFCILLPQPIVEAIGECLEKGHAPLIPNWVTRDDCLFNQRWRDPCTGRLDIAIRNGPARKLLSGVLNRFNFDAHGSTHTYPWPVPQEWIDRFATATRELSKQALSDGPTERSSYSLGYGRSTIPILLRGETCGDKYFKLTGAGTSSVTGVRADITTPTPATLQEADLSQEAVEPEPEEAVCSGCSNNGEGHTGGWLMECTTDDCSLLTCPACDRPCTRCGDIYCANHVADHALCYTPPNTEEEDTDADWTCLSCRGHTSRRCECREADCRAVFCLGCGWLDERGTG